MNLFIRAFNSNWVFSRPQKKEILIYDSISKNTAKYLFHKTECEVLNVRYETINIFIFGQNIIGFIRFKFMRI